MYRLSFIQLHGRLRQLMSCARMAFNLSPVEKVFTCFISVVEHWRHSVLQTGVLFFGASAFMDRMVLDVHLLPFGIYYIWLWHKCYIKRIITKNKSVSTDVFSLIWSFFHFFLQTECKYLKLLKPMKLDAVDAIPSLLWLHHNLF